VTEVADAAGTQPLVLSLVITPFATELPETINSFVWARAGKDGLALGNISGAMVFQSTVPVAFGLAFTTGGWTPKRWSSALSPSRAPRSPSSSSRSEGVSSAAP
jgi:cation:H+ antiporter